jgi:hypothetical protein
MRSARTQRRIKEKVAKDLYELTVECVFYRSQPINKNRKDKLFEEYSERWGNYCFKQRSNKAITANSNAFKNIIGSVRKVRQYQRMLGLPEEKLTLWQRIFG